MMKAQRKWHVKNLLSVEYIVIGLAGRCLLTAGVNSVHVPHVEASDARRDSGDQDRNDEGGLHGDEMVLVICKC
jgi:hypothetical protein